MSDEGTTDGLATPSPGPARGSEPVPHWSRAQLIVFRFAFAIVALGFFGRADFVADAFLPKALNRVADAVLYPPGGLLWDAFTTVGTFVIRALKGQWPPVRELAISSPLPVLSFLPGLFILASLIALVWTVFDRHRANYSTLNRLMRVYLRYVLGAVVLTYAFLKVIPAQFGFLTPGELLLPFGHLSRFWVMWDFMAASPGYTIFTGTIELLGATMLFFRRTTLLGGLILAGALTNIVALDLFYGVGAVTSAANLLVLDLIVLAPYLPAVLDIFVLRRRVELPSEPVPVRRRWYYSPAVKGLLLCALSFPLVHRTLARQHSYFGAGHPVFGLFDVTTFVRNGKPITPLASDSATWKRVASDGRYGTSGPSGLSVQFANGGLRKFHLADDTIHHKWTISHWGQNNSTPVATLQYAVLQDRDVSLDGKLGNDSVHMLLHPVDMKKFFPLLTK